VSTQTLKLFGAPTKYSRAQARLEAADTKTEPSLQPLTTVKSIDLICHLWQQYVNIALLPLASSSVTIRREMVVFNNQTINRIETGTNNLLQRIADGMHFGRSLIDTSLTIVNLLSHYWMAVDPTRKTETKRLQAAQR
jgi:hypothetical protein